MLGNLPALQVKNIEKIELGRYEMETWYFSPFPIEYRQCKASGACSDGGWICAAEAAWSPMRCCWPLPQLLPPLLLLPLLLWLP